MDRSLRMTSDAERAEFTSAYELEQQLKAAERRYAEARAAADKARAELRELSARRESSPIATQAARGRFESLAARCARLRDVIESIEERLEG
jgi:chromosome segregation ATPase